MCIICGVNPSRSSPLHIVAGNGGVRVLSCVGALCELESRGFRIGSVAGCSAGSLFAALVGGGLAASEILEAMRVLDFRKAAGKPRLPGTRKHPFASLLPPNFSLYQRSGLPAAFSKLLGGDIRLEEMKLPFAAGAVDINNLEPVIYTSQRNGEMRLQEVLERCVAVPGLYPPVRSGSRMIVDGAFATQLNLTLSAVKPIRYQPVIMTCHVHPTNKHPKNLHEYLARAVEASVATHDKFVLGEAEIEVNSKRMRLLGSVWWIRIFCPEIAYDDFLLTLDQKERLFQAGIEAVRRSLAPDASTARTAARTDSGAHDELAAELGRQVLLLELTVENVRIENLIMSNTEGSHNVVSGSGNVVGARNESSIRIATSPELILSSQDAEQVLLVSEAFLRIKHHAVSRSIALQAAAIASELGDELKTGDQQKTIASISRWKQWWNSLHAEARSGLATSADIVGVALPIAKVLFGVMP